MWAESKGESFKRRLQKELSPLFPACIKQSLSLIPNSDKLVFRESSIDTAGQRLGVMPLLIYCAKTWWLDYCSHIYSVSFYLIPTHFYPSRANEFWKYFEKWSIKFLLCKISTISIHFLNPLRVVFSWPEISLFLNSMKHMMLWFKYSIWSHGLNLL